MHAFLQELLIPITALFARGGGGGSGGGSGDGGIIALIGYVPMHMMGAAFRKRSKKSESLTLPLTIIGWIIAVVYAGALTYMWKGLGFYIAAAALIGFPAGLYGWFSKVKQSKFVKKNLQTAAQNDAAWDEQSLVNFATKVFMQYQADWSSQNVESIKTYATPKYGNHASLLLYTMQLMGRTDKMTDIVITEAKIVGMTDVADNNKDSFTIGITAAAHDQLFENGNDKPLFTDNSEFTEWWSFNRQGNTWLLDSIAQSTANPSSTNDSLKHFAIVNNYYFSEDMGWLFIPKSGLLFGGAQFGRSDINNHVVGLYNNQLLVQLYSYVKDPNNNTKPYVIAQVNVPRQYGHIVVRRDKLVQMPIFGDLKRVQTEWTTFNKKYEVFATSEEQAASFELLNPTYMEQLEALPFEVNIEVVDNIIYLYTNERGSDVKIYETMLDLINKAFKEMKL